MYGLGIIKGMGVTLKHFIETYVDDFRWGVKRYTTDQGFEARQGTETRGIFTVQYPEEKIAVPERFSRRILSVHRQFGVKTKMPYQHAARVDDQVGVHLRELGVAEHQIAVRGRADQEGRRSDVAHPFPSLAADDLEGHVRQYRRVR